MHRFSHRTSTSLTTQAGRCWSCVGWGRDALRPLLSPSLATRLWHLCSHPALWLGLAAPRCFWWARRGDGWRLNLCHSVSMWKRKVLSLRTTEKETKYRSCKSDTLFGCLDFPGQFIPTEVLFDCSTVRGHWESSAISNRAPIPKVWYFTACENSGEVTRSVLCTAPWVTASENRVSPRQHPAPWPRWTLQLLHPFQQRAPPACGVYRPEPPWVPPGKGHGDR